MAIFDALTINTVTEAQYWMKICEVSMKEIFELKNFQAKFLCRANRLWKLLRHCHFFCIHRQRTRNAVGEKFSVGNFEAIIIDIHVWQSFTCEGRRVETGGNGQTSDRNYKAKLISLNILHNLNRSLTIARLPCSQYPQRVGSIVPSPSIKCNFKP